MGYSYIANITFLCIGLNLIKVGIVGNKINTTKFATDLEPSILYCRRTEHVVLYWLFVSVVPAGRSGQCEIRESGRAESIES